MNDETYKALCELGKAAGVIVPTALLLTGILYGIGRFATRHFKEEPDKERKRIGEILQGTEVLDGLRRLYFDGGTYRTTEGKAITPVPLGLDVFDFSPRVTLLPPPQKVTLLDKLDRRMHPDGLPKKSGPRSLDEVLVCVKNNGEGRGASYFSFEKEREVHGDVVLAVAYFK